MATPLNTFKTRTSVLTQNGNPDGPNAADPIDTMYSVPAGITAIVLMAQVSNITLETETVTFVHYDTGNNVTTELVKDFPVAKNDAASVITGKLIVQERNQIRAYASNGSALKLTLSFLESLNG